MRLALVLGRRLPRSRYRSLVAKPIYSRRFTMGSTGLQSAGGNGKTNTWEGLGAAEFDLRSECTRRNQSAIGTKVCAIR